MAENITPPMAAKKQKMKWTREKDEVLCRQILAERPYQFKKYTSKLTETWQLIVDALSAIDGFEYVTLKGMRDHFGQLMDGGSKQVNAEKK